MDLGIQNVVTSINPWKAGTFPHLVPEILHPPEPGAAIWVFALPEGGHTDARATFRTIPL